MKRNNQTVILGARIKGFYESAGISQAEVARMFHTRQSWVSRIYNGEFTGRSVVAKKLCERANIPFLVEDSSDSTDDTKISKIAAELVKMKSSDVEAITKLYGLLKKLQ